MLPLLLRWLHRFRWPVITGLVVLVVLGFLLQPRPYARTWISYETLKSPFLGEHVTFSPTGRYVLLKSSFEDAALVDLTMGRIVFALKLGMSSHYRFDAAEGLVYSTTDNWKEVQLYRWQPGQTGPVKVLTRPAIIPSLDQKETIHSMAFDGVADLANSQTANAFLSPDVSRWLVPIRNKDAIRFEMIDANTGSILYELPFQVIATKEKVKPRCEVNFCHDSTLLLVQYPRENEYKRLVYAMIMVDVRSGKTLWESTLPDNIKFDHTICFNDEHIMGWHQEEETGHAYLQEFSPQRGWKRTLIKESVADPIEFTTKPGEGGATKAQVELQFTHDARSNRIIYCWKHWASSVGGLSGGLPYLPGYYYAMRDAVTGQLLRTLPLPSRPRGKDDYHEEGWKVLELLPGPKLLMMEPRPDNFEHPPKQHASWKKTLDAWREQYAPWLSSFLNDESHLITLNAATGVMSDRIRLGIDQEVKAQYLPQCQSVFVTYDQGDMIHILQYRYPFQKPWMLILGWSLSTMLVLIVLQLLLSLTRRARNVMPTVAVSG